MKGTRKWNRDCAVLLLALASIVIFGGARDGRFDSVHPLRSLTEFDAMRASIDETVAALIERSGIMRGPIVVEGMSGGSTESIDQFRYDEPWEIADVIYASVPTASANVAILGGPAVSMWNTDVRSKLLDTGYFSSVAVINIAVVTPTFNELLAFDAVLVYSDAPQYQDGTLLGDVLADYVDAGFGVVCAVFCTASIPFGGRFMDENYWAIAPSGHTNLTPDSLGTIYDPTHPIMAGVSNFDGGSSSYRTTSFDVAAGASRVADWTDGRPLVATKVVGGTKRADLGFYPPSSDSRFDFWEATTDGDVLMANTLVWVTRADTCVSDGDVNNDGILTAGDALCCFNISLLDGTLPLECDVPNWDCEVIACDVNCNDRLTAGDALEIFDHSLLGGGPDNCFAQRSSPATRASSEMNAFAVPVKDAVSTGNVLTVPVLMEATRGATAFGFEVHFDAEKLKFDGLFTGEAAEHWKGLGARELQPGRVRVMGFDTEGLKERDVSQGRMVAIAKLRFKKLTDDAQLRSVVWIEQRLDRESYEEPRTARDRVTKLELGRPYPNPFREAVSADVLVPRNEESTVRVAIYDVKGRLVRTLLNRTVSGGVQTVTWDRRGETGQQVSSGIYFIQISSTELGVVDTKKVVVIK